MAATTSTTWIQPCAQAQDELKRWGHPDGLQVSLSGEGGPHGLLYLYHDSIVQKAGHPINFIAIEPVVNRVRCYSELERSELDARNGKRFWSSDTPRVEPLPQNDYACGIITQHATTQSLQVYVMAEPFLNGAHVHLRLTFRSDAPDELDLETYASPGSARMSHCILTATMGNFARLRELHLADGTSHSKQLWPNYQGHEFARAVDFPLSRFNRTSDAAAFVVSQPDEVEPSSTKAPGHWNYIGARAFQFWRLSVAEARPHTLARVNGRYTYWMSQRPIPGGISFENFELQRLFISGEKTTFGVTTDSQVLKTGRGRKARSPLPVAGNSSPTGDS